MADIAMKEHDAYRAADKFMDEDISKLRANVGYDTATSMQIIRELKKISKSLEFIASYLKVEINK